MKNKILITISYLTKGVPCNKLLKWNYFFRIYYPIYFCLFKQINFSGSRSQPLWPCECRTFNILNKKNNHKICFNRENLGTQLLTQPLLIIYLKDHLPTKEQRVCSSTTNYVESRFFLLVRHRLLTEIWLRKYNKNKCFYGHRKNVLLYLRKACFKVIKMFFCIESSFGSILTWQLRSRTTSVVGWRWPE